MKNNVRFGDDHTLDFAGLLFIVIILSIVIISIISIIVFS